MLGPRAEEGLWDTLLWSSLVCVPADSSQLCVLAFLKLTVSSTLCLMFVCRPRGQDTVVGSETMGSFRGWIQAQQYNTA